MNGNCFVSIDFDGTIVEHDITDAIIQEFARPGWEIAERLWEEGAIGSRECLAMQMALVDQPLQTICSFIDRFSIDPTFPAFLSGLQAAGIHCAVISDGFRIGIERLMKNAGIDHLPPIFANDLVDSDSGLKAVFPHASRHCSSGVCKCTTAHRLCGERRVVLIGDGRSDFCLAEKADYVFSKGRLRAFCTERGLPNTAFQRFSDVAAVLSSVCENLPLPETPSRLTVAMRARTSACML